MARQIVPFQPNQGISRYRRPQGAASANNSPTCPNCGSRYHLRSFSSIYGRGTTFYTRMKGFVLRHGYERTRKQTYQALQCRPPAKFPWFPAVFALAGCLGMRWLAYHWEANYYDLMIFQYYSGWAAVLLAGIAFIYNQFLHPRRMAVWSTKFLCERCGTISVHEGNLTILRP